MHAHPGGVLFNCDVYIDTTLKVAGGFLILAQTAIDTWTETMGVSGTTGNITTNGTITAVGNINGKTGSCTGTGKPLAPTAAGVYMGLDTTAADGIEICSSSIQYIDFTIPSSDYKRRMTYNNTDSSFHWFLGGSATTKMTLNFAALYVGGTTVSSSGKRLEFNEKPLTNALDVISRLELVE